MQVLSDISSIPANGQPLVLATGCFDGVHLGHQHVIQTAVNHAAACGGQAWVLTFDPHPAKVLAPATAPPLISARPCRLRRFAALGVDGVIEIPFTEQVAQIDPTAFLNGLHTSLPSLRAIVCGADWSFGYNARGTVDLLKEGCALFNVEVIAVPPVLFAGEKISSTSIRCLIADGHVDAAAHRLGRPVSLFGRVVSGRGVGRELGFPTANIEPENELIPGPGVYAATGGIFSPAHPPDQRAAVFIGERMTFNDRTAVVEAHLLDFTGDLVGQQMELCLLQKLRTVEKFEDRNALRGQIERDLIAIRNLTLNLQDHGINA